ncbi:hypothetical protein [Lentibacillus amyloliquefaciens]|uniref:hypothetical protein n=1 Tax=Lentibacillus amyloliquefaciens TaxID=1472767 RepID=UPI001F2A3F78|nr:hypothetical protein [Lentibacillus amyloliquefaciens]
MKLWETFDKNEIYILVMLVVVFVAFFMFPKKLPRHITLLFLVWGFTTSTFYDFTIGGGLMDFYKVNDSNKYELIDLLTYFCLHRSAISLFTSITVFELIEKHSFSMY